jgi:calcium-dependent protein kinase
MEGVYEWFVQNVGGTRDIVNTYHLDGTSGLLGYGSFGKVLKGKHKVTGSVCAVKQIEKLLRNQIGSKPAVRSEIAIMQSLDHPHLVKLIDHFEDDNFYYLAMDLCIGGKIIDFISRGHQYQERDAAIIMEQLFSAIDYLHERHIVHLDVKPDNMLFESSDAIAQNRVKLIDFGISCSCSYGQTLRKSAGTPEFMAPEVIDSHFGTQADLWSCGVTMFELLCGYTPFRGETEAGLFAVVRRGNFNFAEKDWGRISQDAKDLIRALLRLNPRERLSAQDALDHTWTRLAPDFEQSTHLLSAVKHFRSRSAQRKRPVQEADALVNVRAVLEEVTQWANAMFGQTPFDDPCIMKDRMKNHTLQLQWV